MGVLLRVLYKMAPETGETWCMTTDVTAALDMGVLLRVLYKMAPENRGNMVYDHRRHRSSGYGCAS